MKTIYLEKVRPGAEDSVAPVGTIFRYTYKTADLKRATSNAQRALTRQIREENILDWKVVDAPPVPDTPETEEVPA